MPNLTAEAAIAEVIQDASKLKTALQTAAKKYHDPKSEKPGLLHGQKGKNRARYLEETKEENPVALFAMLYVVLHSSSTALTYHLTQELIKGDYSKTVATGLDNIRDQGDLTSEVIAVKALQTSKNNPSNYQEIIIASQFGFISNSSYEKKQGMRSIVTSAQTGMSTEAQNLFDEQVARLKGEMEQPSNDTEMRKTP